MTKQENLKVLYTSIARSENDCALDVIEKNPDLLAFITPNGSWLHVAARNGNKPMVEYLVTAGLDVNSSEGSLVGTPLNLAASEGHLDIVKYLFKHGARFDVSAPENNPLYAAIHKGHMEVFRFLIESGIDAFVDYGSSNAMSFAKQYGRNEMVLLLESIGGRCDVGNSPSPNLPFSADLSIHESVIGHLKLHFGTVEEVSLRDVIGDLMIHVVPSTPERKCITLITSGSAIRGANCRHEFIMRLATDWKLTDLKNEDNYWPIKWLREISGSERILSSEDTLSFAESAFLAPSTKLSGFLILSSPEEYGVMQLQDGETIVFLDLVPLYSEEIQFKKERGTIELLRKFQENGVTLVLDPRRINIAQG